VKRDAVCREDAEVTSAGRAFQTRAPATEKVRLPKVASLTAGTHRSSEVEDRSLCRVGMLATDVNWRRYWGASPCGSRTKGHTDKRPPDKRATATHLRVYCPAPNCNI